MKRQETDIDNQCFAFIQKLRIAENYLIFKI